MSKLDNKKRLME